MKSLVESINEALIDYDKIYVHWDISLKDGKKILIGTPLVSPTQQDRCYSWFVGKLSKHVIGDIRLIKRLDYSYSVDEFPDEVLDAAKNNPSGYFCVELPKDLADKAYKYEYKPEPEELVKYMVDIANA